MFKKRHVTSATLFLLLINIVFPGFHVFADANSLMDLEISVYINEDGSADIIEKRYVYLIEGTENYIVVSNLKDENIVAFQVREDGVQYQFQDDWDVKASRQEKAYKNGILGIKDGYELTWGIGEYGEHLYEVEYRIINFIKQYEDKQGVLWRFVNDKTTSPPENVSLTIGGDRDFFDSNSKIWAFGYEGNIEFDDGKIIAYSRDPFTSVNHMTILLELDQGMYNTSSMINKPFQEIKDEAFRGSDYKSDTNLGEFDLFGLLVPYGMMILFVLFFIFARNKGKNPRPRSFKRKFKGEYYRDYPYEGDFQDIYYLLNNMGVANIETLMTGFILKWIHKEYIFLDKVEVGRIFKKEEIGLKFVNREIDSTTVGDLLYQMMLEAAGSNEVLESNEFTNWAKKNYKKLEAWEEEAKRYSSDKLESLGLVELMEKKILFFTSYDLVITEKGQELEDRIHRFINYLYDFSLLNEHEAINVGIWDNLMIWAGVLGITEVVAKEFEKLYPRYELDSIYRGNAIYMAHSFSKNASSAVMSRRASGGGGFSSFGGGGGFSGGGSGGGTR